MTHNSRMKLQVKYWEYLYLHFLAFAKMSIISFSSSSISIAEIHIILNIYNQRVLRMCMYIFSEM